MILSFWLDGDDSWGEWFLESSLNSRGEGRDTSSSGGYFFESCPKFSCFGEHLDKCLSFAKILPVRFDGSGMDGVMLAAGAVDLMVVFVLEFSSKRACL